MVPVLVVSVFLLTAAGVYLLLERSVFRVILGTAFLTHAANLLVLAGGRWLPEAPVVTPEATLERMADPLPHALLLTAIVISLAMTLYLLAVAAANAMEHRITEVEPPPQSDAGRAREEIVAELAGSDFEAVREGLRPRRAEHSELRR